MVIMRLDEEAAKVMDPTKGSRRKQSKPNRVSLVDLPPPSAGGDQQHGSLLAEAKDLDAELPQTSAMHEDMHDEDDLDAAAMAAHDTAGRHAEAPMLSFACHLCGLGFSTRQLLEQHERHVHLKPDVMQPEASGDFPTAYHRLASEFLGHTSKVLLADGTHVEEHLMDASTDEGDGAATSEGGSTPQAQAAGIFHPEAYCEICQREFCNKYFLKTHKANIHGVHDTGAAAATTKDSTPPGHALDRDRSSGTAAASPVLASAAVGGVSAAAVASGAAASKEMFSGVISSGGDICDICQKPFRNKYYIKRHKLHVHGVATTSPLTPGTYHGGSAGEAPQPSPRSSVDAGTPSAAATAAVTAAVGAAAAPGPVVLEHGGASDGDSLVGCNMCTRKFSSMHAVKIHRASAHGVYARDLAAAAATAAAIAASGMSAAPVGRSAMSSILVDAAGTKSDRGGAAAADPLTAYKRVSASAGGSAAYLPPAVDVRPGSGGSLTVSRHVHLPFEGTPSRVRGTLLTQAGGGGSIGDSSPAPLALVAHGMPVDGTGWSGPQSSGGNALSTVVALSYHRPGVSAAATAAVAASGAAAAAGAEGGKVSLLLPPAVPSELVSLDAKDTPARDTSINCDQCQKSFANVYLLKAHRAAAHAVDKPASELPHASADPAVLPFAVGFGRTASPGSGSVASSTADGAAAVTEYKQWRWKEHANQTRVYCDICNKELCNKYFLRTHKLKKHGISASLDGGETTSGAVSPYGRGTSPQVIAQAGGVAATSGREMGVDQCAESCSNSGDAEAERFQSSERSCGGSMSSSAADVSGCEGAATEEAGAGDASAAAKLAMSADLGRGSGGRPAAFSASATVHLAGQDVKVEAGACRSCGTEFDDLQAALSHSCEPGGDVHRLPGSVGGGGTAQGYAAEELKSGSGNGGGSSTLPFAALLGMQKFQWKSRGGRAGTIASGGQSAAAAAAGEKLYSCSRCDYKTPWLSNIYSHEQRKHGGGSSGSRGSGATPHTCTVCLRTFSYEHSLMRHMADYHNGAGSGGSVIVTSEQPAGTTVVSPRRHQRARCPHCNKQFVNKFLCQSHIRSSHGAVAPPIAAVGGGGSSNGYTVMRAGATGYKLYACDRCGFKCRTLSNLRMHQVIKHSTVASMQEAADGAAAHYEQMEGGMSDAVAAEAERDEQPMADDEGLLTNGSAALLSPGGSSVAAQYGGINNAAQGIIMQPFVVEAVDGGPEFALTSVHLPVYRKVKGTMQVTLTLRSVDD